MSEAELESLEARLVARPGTGPVPTLRGRALDALEREGRREVRAWSLMTAAAWIAVGANWLSRDPRTERLEGRTDVSALAERLEDGPDLSELPRLARPIGSLARWVP